MTVANRTLLPLLCLFALVVGGRSKEHKQQQKKHPVITMATLQDKDFLGCYKIPANSKDFSYVAFVAKPNDTNVYINCRQWCANFLHFALVGGNECHCGMNVSKYEKATNCNLTCAGVPGTKCGGVGAYQIYRSQYRGCFRDSKSDPDLQTQRLDAGYTGDLPTSPQCSAKCQQYNFYALQNGTDCWCGNSFGKHGQLADAACNVTCPYNAIFPVQPICGGVLANQIYRTSNLGCFADNPRARDMATRGNVTGGDVETNNYSRCYVACADHFDFFALQNGHECWCGNSFGRYGKSDSCNMPCLTDTADSGPATCGGKSANQVYSVWL